MAAEDELSIPELPQAKPDDHEDVSWALETAEAMWARGDHLEGIKWVRKAAEAASDVEQDARALELAKAASELASLIARRSHTGDSERRLPARVAPEAPPTQPTNVHASGARTSGAPPPPASAPSRPPLMPKGPSVAPPAPHAAIALPSRPSTAPKPPQTPSTPPRPLATADARQGPQAGRGILTNRTAPDKSAKARRRSRENLDVEAKAAAALLAPNVTLGKAGPGVVDTPLAASRMKRRSRSDADVTKIGPLDARGMPEHDSSADVWDAHPTQSLSNEEMDKMSEGDRKPTTSVKPPKPSAPPPPPVRVNTGGVHDPGIQTSQAVRVIVWRDGTGVHIAPAGTVVSSITIDAVLVALEPSADLTAWLSQRTR